MLRMLVHRTDQLRYVLKAMRTQQAVKFRDFLGQFFAVTLGEASGRHKFFAASGRFLIAQFENAIDRFLAGSGQESTGVDDDHLRILFGFHKLVPSLREVGEHDFRIHAVLGATEGFQIDSLGGDGCHGI